MRSPEVDAINDKWIPRLRAAAEHYYKYSGRIWIDHPEPLIELSEYLGDPYVPGERGLIIDITNPEIQQKIDMLAGPHWYAVMKAWEANKNDATD